MSHLAIDYSYRLILVSVMISIISAYAAFVLAERTHRADTQALRIGWLLGGSFALGAGIWSMHYLGMLAMRLPVEVLYFVPTVAMSLALAVGASAVALMIVGGRAPGWKRLALGGVLMGSGIGGMHYTGMSAMRMSAMEHYSVWIVVLSIVVAVGSSWLALWIGVSVRKESGHGESLRVLAAVVMGLGIASTHYIAMAGMTYVPSGGLLEAGRWTLRVGTLGVTGVALTTVFILTAALGMAALDKHLFRELKASHSELLEIQKRLTEANLMLSELSNRDGLTGLCNRRCFDSAFDTEWRRAVRFNRPLSLLMMDVDCFKGLNDTYGHQQGDYCLREIARLLEEGPRRGYDMVARIGGEEFAVLAPSAEAAGARHIAETIVAAVRSLGIENKSSPSGLLTVSIGVCSRAPRFADHAEDMIRDADMALYTAKRLGRDRVELAEDGSRKRDEDDRLAVAAFADF